MFRTMVTSVATLVNDNTALHETIRNQSTTIDQLKTSIDDIRRIPINGPCPKPLDDLMIGSSVVRHIDVKNQVQQADDLCWWQ